MSRGDIGGPGYPTPSGGPGYTGYPAGPVENREDVIDQLNSLLRGEISATETYQSALDKLSGTTGTASGNVGLISQLHNEHQQACEMLRQRVVELGGRPSETSGAWGAWASTVQGTANLFGDTSALKSLKEGEEHGLKEYEDALDEVDPGTAEMIRGQCIPAQQRHIATLDQLIQAAGRRSTEA